MRQLAQLVGYPILGVVYISFTGLTAVYTVDIFHDIFINGRFLIFLIMVFAYPLLTLILYYAALVAAMPLSLATSDDSGPWRQIIGLFLTPVGLLGGFLLWQAQNWFMFGFINIEPWLYNTVFRQIGLEV